MKELMMTLDWGSLISTLWTVILLPILTYVGQQIYVYAKEKKVDRYVDILKNRVFDAVKEIYETTVKDIKNTPEWTPEKQAWVKDMAILKAKQALTIAALNCLSDGLVDFDKYLEELVGTALYDLKNK